jgi:RNA-binding protein YlmH
MLPNEADAALKDIEGILQQISRYHQLTEEQRLALHTRAGLARQKIGDVLKLLKKLTKAVETE